MDVWLAELETGPTLHSDPQGRPLAAVLCATSDSRGDLQLQVGVGIAVGLWLNAPMALLAICQAADRKIVALTSFLLLRLFFFFVVFSRLTR